MSDPKFIEDENEEELITTVVKLIRKTEGAIWINPLSAVIITGQFVEVRIVLRKINAYYLPTTGQMIHVHLDSGLKKIRFKNRKVAKLAISELDEILENS